MNIILLKYNNYYNRRLKIGDYFGENNENVVHQLNNAAFNFNDGIYTQHVFNTHIDSGSDYALVYDDNQISRWFVMEEVYLRNGQTRIELLRDVFADNWEEIKTATAYIEKATVTNSDPAIFNRENVQLNQIKKSQTPLKDNTNSAWVCGYVANNYSGGTITGTGYDVKNAKHVDVLGTQKSRVSTLGLEANLGHSATNAILISVNDTVNLTDRFAQIDYKRYYIEGRYGRQDLYVIGNKLKDIFDSDDVQNQISIIAGTNVRGQLFNNDIIEYNNNYYRIYDVNTQYVQSTTYSNNMPTLTAIVNEALPLTSGDVFLDLNPNGASANGSLYVYNVVYTTTYQYEQININENYSVTIPNDFRKLVDAPYSMFCIPLNTMSVSQQGTYWETDEQSALGIATQISTSLASNCYDIQILPYCPIKEIRDKGYIDSTDFTAAQMQVVTSGSSNVNVLIWSKVSSFTLDIDVSIPVDDYKVSNECDLYRICSPNYSSIYEFSPAKNGGVEYINVDATYKPYSPYIKLNPNFKNLYGDDYNDARGLILSGDFSLPLIKDAWEAYQVQNKYYQEIFDRQIESVEFNNRYAKMNDVINAITGTATGATAGAVGGAQIGGIGGGAIGAAAGGILSGIGGALDVNINEKIRNESLDLTKDLFELNNRSIQAVPRSVSHSTVLTYNYAYFPFIEYYTCTDVEREAFKHKIQYNGMTIGRIGTIEEFLKSEYTYIKGQIIMYNDSFTGDYHLANMISQEFNRGMRLREYTE